MPHAPNPPSRGTRPPALTALDSLQTRFPDLPIIRVDLVPGTGTGGVIALMVRVPSADALCQWSTALGGSVRHTGLTRFGSLCDDGPAQLDNHCWWRTLWIDLHIDGIPVRIWHTEVNDPHIGYLELAAAIPFRKPAAPQAGTAHQTAPSPTGGPAQ